MPFYSYDDVLRISRIIQETPCEISEELRGWNWFAPPLLPVHGLQINVSDLSFSCKTGRLAFLRYRMRVKERNNERLRFGAFVHRVISMATNAAKSILYSSTPNNGAELLEKMLKEMERILQHRDFPENYVKVFKTLWNRAALTYSSSLDKVLELSRYLSLDGLVNRVVPWICEFPVDGRPLGLSRAARIDALIPPALIIEFKTRRPSRSTEVALTAYALSFECQYRIPIDHAIILYIEFEPNGSSFRTYEKVLKIDESLRLEFIEIRDLYASKASLDVDPGIPENCDAYCPYLEVCRNGR
ncbi:MAG: type I-A CRISPR-associated protein Cas4/Csa1 [Aigarchaeota archaeon]|nr:type I-A CRISPR-associated protein Cas4/Csa1 [Aigarchaeota archaeon]